MLKSIPIILALWLLPVFDWGKANSSSSKTQENRYFCATNTLAMNNRLCMDITEVSAMVWKLFLEDMKTEFGEGSEEYYSNIPDFKMWTTIFPDMNSSKISRLFMEEETLDLMPVVGVSFSQVLAFCKWRIKRFQKDLDEMNPEMRSKFPKKFIFRLPTNKEWARIKYMTQDKKMLKKLDNLAQKNMKFFKLKKNKIINSANLASHIYKTKTDYLGIYNIFDNVAEMTAEEGIAMGGSWNEANKKSKYNQEFTYEGAQPWLGFRCIFEIVE